MKVSLRFNTPVPTIIEGFLASLNFLENPLLPLTIFSISDGFVPRCSKSYVKSEFSPIRAILVFPASQDFLIRVFTREASSLGLAPIIKIASDSSIPFMVELKRYVSLWLVPMVIPSCLQSIFFTPKLFIKSISAFMDSASHRSPAMAAILLGSPESFSAAKFNASSHSATRSFPPTLTYGLSRR